MLILGQWIVRRIVRKLKNTTHIAMNLKETEVGIGSRWAWF